MTEPAIASKDLRLYVYVAEADGNWHEAAQWAPDEVSTHGPGTESWKRTLSLAEREVLMFGAVFALHNSSVAIEVWKDGKMLVQVLAAKFKAASYDPSIILLTPGGTHIEVMIGGAARSR
jgi:hypothetical protein